MVIYPAIELDIKLPDNLIFKDLVKNHERNRNLLRELVINELIKERAGTGNGEQASHYKYIVEKLSDGKVIYITRPVPLNKGFDFVVHVEGIIFSNKKDNPKHDDIANDLELKIKTISSNKTKKYTEFMMDILEKVYYCEEPDNVIKNCKTNESSFLEVPGYKLDMILKTVKWLFIEQDIRYWNWSGRAMLMEKLRNSLNIKN